MVKLALSFAALAAVVATVASAPLSQSPLVSHLSFFEPNKCIPETEVFEYHPFYLKSVKLRSLVSTEHDFNILVGGIPGEKSLQELEMCIVSTEHGCDKDIRSNCIYQNVEYRFRVNSPVKGYVKVDGNGVVIVENFHDASPLNLYKEEGWGLRVAQVKHDGSRTVFSATAGGYPLFMQEPVADKQSQWFEIVAPNTARRGVPSIVPSTPNQCIPDTLVYEYHPFKLSNYQLRSVVSKNIDDNLLVGGIPGEKSLEELEMCIVSTEHGCDKDIRSNCIYQNVEYRFRVNSPVQGYLKVVGRNVEIVESFYDASELNLYKEHGWGLRVAQRHPDGTRSVFSTAGGGVPLILEEFVSNKVSQWFGIEASNSGRRGAHSLVPSTPNRCMPGTYLNEYHPFALLNSNLNTLVSRPYKYPYLVGGVDGNRAFEKLNFCIVSTPQACDYFLPSNCIYEDVEYRFRVDGPVEGYLKILYREEEGRGLRVAHDDNGDWTALATNGGGNPLTMEEFKANDSRQWFKIIEENYEEQVSSLVPSTYNRCIPETSLKEYHPFALLSSNLKTLVSRPYRFPLLVGGVSGSKAFEQLNFCIVSSPQACDKFIPSNCIYENVEYRFRVNGPNEGYLRIVGNHLEIVPDFEHASGLNLYKEEGWGLRVAHVEYGHQTVLATNGGGNPLTMEEFKANDSRQWFQIIEENNDVKPYRRF